LNRRFDILAATAGLCVIPLSIAVSEFFLAVALALRITYVIRARMTQDGASLDLPRICWLWLGWAALAVFSWLHSTNLKAGAGEMRHLLLVAAVFLILPALNRPGSKLTVWRGLFLTSSIGSIAVVVCTIARMLFYRREISQGGDAAFYLRNGGFLHHWMVYATVEILIFGALLEFRILYPEERRLATLALALHCLAILFSLTRTLWLSCFLIAAIHLLTRRSKWIWALLALPVGVFLLIPGPVHSRIVDSSSREYYSNAERVQMWRVGWKMIRQHAVFGVGPGRVEELYTSYLNKGEPVPAYRGHLHDNALQLAAQFGLPVLGAAVLWLAFLLWDLIRTWRTAQSRECRFLIRSSFLGIVGFVIAGVTEYTYGHALGLILFCFVAISPLILNTQDY
jgi:O-antigen ligase